MRTENFTIDGLEVAGGTFTVSATVTYGWSKQTAETRELPAMGGDLSFDVTAVEIVEANEGFDAWEPSVMLAITQQIADPSECYLPELWMAIETQLETILNAKGVAA
jgi:hypothetical protein